MKYQLHTSNVEYLPLREARLPIGYQMCNVQIAIICMLTLIRYAMPFCNRHYDLLYVQCALQKF